MAGLPPGDPIAETNYGEVVEQKVALPAIGIDLDKLRGLRDLLAAKFDPATVIDPSIRETALRRMK
jgi:hypothetical protein